jgi:hypothetical protein
MLSALRAKVALLIHTKVGASIVAAVLVAGGGSAVALAATHGNLGQIGSALSSVTGHTDNDKRGDQDATHASAEGMLTAYTAPAGAAVGSITVKPEKGGALTFVITSTTKVNGYHTSGTSDGEHGVATPSNGQHNNGTPTTRTGVDSQTLSLSELAAAVNKDRVQVQANKSGSSWVAWKVTIEGLGNDQDGQTGDSQGHVIVVGKIMSVDLPDFVVTTLKGDVTVVTDGNTRYFGGEGHIASASDLRAQVIVAVQGTKQSNGNVLAILVYVGGHVPTLPPEPMVTPAWNTSSN